LLALGLRLAGAGTLLDYDFCDSSSTLMAGLCGNGYRGNMGGFTNTMAGVCI
jgi:hypothetical protein